MTITQIALVKESWQQVALLDAVVVGGLFYTRLLEFNPALRPLFKSPVPEQSKKLVQMISYVIARLDALDTVMHDIQKLAQRHVRYGVEPKHYDLVGEALIWTLRKGLAGAWNETLEAAWVTCYRLLATAMIDASQEAELA
ncbi:hemoglobin [Flavisolibacter sp. BT320]|nr:hemoglobin [Flavisolibacter longurius]